MVTAGTAIVGTDAEMVTASVVMLIGTVLCARFLFPLDEKAVSRNVWLLLLTLSAIVSCCFGVPAAGWFLMLFLTDLYLLFYAADYQHFVGYCVGQLGIFLLAGLVLCLLSWQRDGDGACFSLFPILFLPLSYLLALWRLHGRNRTQAVLLSVFAAVFFYLGLEGYETLMQICTLGLVGLLWFGYRGFSRDFRRSSFEFQNQVMLHHYEEVKAVYLNMRGWRHDYHNHIQSMKAYLSMGEYEELGRYLGELEQDLHAVDELVKSGNLMVDAVLNSKLSLAKSKQIQVSCKASGFVIFMLS